MHSLHLLNEHWCLFNAFIHCRCSNLEPDENEIQGKRQRRVHEFMCVIQHIVIYTSSRRAVVVKINPSRGIRTPVWSRRALYRADGIYSVIMTTEMTLFVGSELKFSITEREIADTSVSLVLDPSLCRRREREFDSVFGMILFACRSLSF